MLDAAFSADDFETTQYIWNSCDCSKYTFNLLSAENIKYRQVTAKYRVFDKTHCLNKLKYIWSASNYGFIPFINTDEWINKYFGYTNEIQELIVDIALYNAKYDDALKIINEMNLINKSINTPYLVETDDVSDLYMHRPQLNRIIESRREFQRRIWKCPKNINILFN